MMLLDEGREILRSMTVFLPAESLYKQFFVECPGAFNTPIYGWDEFADRLREYGYSGEIPREAPSPIMPWISEAEFFPVRGLDVSIVRNDRYCPPFWHKLEFIKIVYVAKGSAVFFFGNERAELSEGNLFLVPPGVENATFSRGDEDIVINIIVKRSTFERSFASFLMENSLLSDFFWQMLYSKDGDKVLLFRKAGEVDLTEQVLQLYRELNIEKSPSNIMLKSYLMLFFGHMLRHYERSGDAPGDGCGRDRDTRIAEILQYMSEHKETVTLPELASRFHLSEGYMSRFLRQGTGEPFNTLLKKLRIRQAAVMLQNTAMSVEEISAAVGYSDISRFYRNFKEHFGVTPAQFRRGNVN